MIVNIFISLLLLAVLQFAFVQGYGTEVDVSWDFQDNLEGWANATTEEMQMEVRVEGGELRSTIIGDSPHMDSPHMLIDATSRHFVTIRMMYFGGATRGILMLRSGPGIADTVQMDHNSLYWGDRVAATSFSDSGSVNAGNSSAMAVDGNVYTYWSSSTPKAAFVILDLGDTRWITELIILSKGDSNSPKSCLLQKSITAGVGPFETVMSFTLLNNTLTEQKINGFEAHSRYWRIVFVDNYGGPSIEVREINLFGIDESTIFLPFDVDNTGTYKNYYLPIFQYMRGPLIRMRMQIGNDASVKVQPAMPQKHVQKGKAYREGLAVDYIRIVKSPELWRIRGCLDVYYDSANLNDPKYNVTSVVTMINDHLPVFSFVKNQRSNQYATTYDCPLKGGVNVTLQGLNFGANPRIFIGGRECTVLEYAYDAEAGQRVETVVCNLPPSDTPGPVVVRVQNGVLPGLFQELSNVFSYRQAPPVPKKPVATNIGATRVDLVWEPSGAVLDHMAITGYKIIWFQPKFRSRVSNMTVTNITTSSIRGLEPGTEYVFAIAAISEGSFHERAASWATDLYGRRDIAEYDSFEGTFSDFTNITATTFYDFDFTFFSANATLNVSSLKSTINADGPTGQYGGEGNYGLVMVGSANVQNCNASSTCCDGYNSLSGVTSCGLLPTVCATLLADQLAYDYVEDGITRRQVPSNLPYSNGAAPEKRVLTVDELKTNQGADLPNIGCGPAMRLTPSNARESGSMWYGRKMNVAEGFDTTFEFEISNPSQICDTLDDVSTYCRSRGSDGMAFVIQGISPVALGKAGSGIGYEGIMNSIAVEIDTYFNYDQLDYYENHVAVMTQGWRFNISANHSYSLATTTRIPDMTDGVHKVRIKYDPNFNENAVLHPSFQVNGFTSFFFQVSSVYRYRTWY